MKHSIFFLFLLLFIFPFNLFSEWCIWDGSVDSEFSNPGNWSDVPENDGNDRIVITTSGNPPILDAADFATTNFNFERLTIQSGATLTVNIDGSADLSVTSNNDYTNNGTLILSGTGLDISFSGAGYSGTLGNVELDGSGTVNYYEFDGLTLTSGDWAFPSAATDTIIINGNALLSAGNFYVYGHEIDLSGDWTNNGGCHLYDGTDADVGILNLVGPASVNVTGNTIFYGLSCSIPAKQITFGTGSVQTVISELVLEGDATNDLVLTGAGDWTIDNRAAINTVNYIDVTNGNADTSDIFCDIGTSTLTTCNGLYPGTVSAQWINGSVFTWTGNAVPDSAWSTPANWDIGVAPDNTGDEIIIIPAVATVDPVLDGDVSCGYLRVESAGALSGTNQVLSVAGNTFLQGTVTFSGAATLNLNGGISSLTGTVSVSGGSLNVTAASDMTLTGSLDAGTGSININLYDGTTNYDLLGDGAADTNYDLRADAITISNPFSLIGNSGDPIDTASPNDCALDLPGTANVGLYISHAGSMSPIFDGGAVTGRVPALSNFPTSFTATGNIALPGVNFVSGTGILYFNAGGTLTVPDAADLTSSDGDITLTGDTIIIANEAAAENITSTGAGNIILTETTGAGTFTLNKALSANTGNISIYSDGGNLALGDAVTVTNAAGSALLRAYGTITQTAAGIVSANTLTAQTRNDSGGSDITLSQINSTSLLTLQSVLTDGTTPTGGNLIYVDDGGFTIDQIDTTGYADLTCNIGAPNNGTADINQTSAAGSVRAGGLVLRGTGDVGLDNPNGNNSVTTIAASIYGDFLYAEDGDVEIGSVNGVNGLTSLGNDGIASNGDEGDIRLLLHNADNSYTFSFTQTQPVSCTGLILEGNYGSFDLGLTASNDIDSLAVYSDTEGEPVRTVYRQTGNIGLSAVSVNGTARTGIAYAENLTLAGGELVDNGQDITVAGDVALTLSAASAMDAGNAWIFNGTTNFSVTGSFSFNDIQLGTATAGGSLAFTGTSAQTITGDFSVLDAAATSWDITNDTIDIAGNAILTNLDTFTSAGSAVDFNGGAVQTVTSATHSFNNVTVSNAGINASDAFDATGTVVFSAGTSATDGTLTIAGNLNLTGGTLTGGNDTTDLIQINGGDLIIDTGAQLTGTGYMDINGNVSLADNTSAFFANDRQISISGNWTETGTVFDVSTGTGISRLIFDGAASAGTPATITAVSAIDDLYVVNDTNLDMGSAVTCGSIVINNNSGTSILDTGGFGLIAGGTVSGTGTLQTAAGETLNLEGNVTVATLTVPGTTAPTIQAANGFTPGAFTCGNSIVELDGANAADLGRQTYYNLNVTKSAADVPVTVTGAAGTLVVNNLTLILGDLDIGTYGLTVSNTFSNDPLANGTTTLILEGAAGQTVSFLVNDIDSGEIRFEGAGTTLAGLTDFYNLTLAGTGDRTFPAAVDVYHDLDASADTGTHNLNANSTVLTFRDDAGSTGTYTPPGTASDLTYYGLAIEAGNTLTAAGDIVLAQNWTNGGNFIHGGNMVEFVSATTSLVTGNNTFADLRCDLDTLAIGKTISFADSSSTLVEGTLFIRGDNATNLVTLTSPTATGWTLSLTNPGLETVEYAAVQYGQVGGLNNITADNSIDVGLTCDTTAPGWIFTPKDVVWLGNTDSNWFTDTNWDWGYVPNNSDNVQISTVTNDPEILNSESDVLTNNLIIDAGCSLRVETGRSLTVNGPIYNNLGTLYREGTSTVNVTDVDSGSTIYTGSNGTVQNYFAGADYFILEIDGVTVDMGAAIQTDSNLVFSNNAVLDTSGTNLTVNGTVSGAGTIQSNGAETIDLNGNVTVDAIDFTGGTPVLTAAADFTPSAFTAGGSSVTLDSGAAADLGDLTGTPDVLTFYDLNINKTAGTVVQSTTDMAVTNALTLTSGDWQAANGTNPNLTHIVSNGWDGNTNNANFDFIPGSSTLNISGGAISHGAGEGFYNLTTDGAVGLGTALAVGNDLLIHSGTLTATGSLGITVGGNWTNSGTFDGANGLVTLGGTGNIAGMDNPLPGTTDNFFDLTISGGTRTSLANVIVRNAAAVTGGTFDLSSGTRAISADSLTISTGTMTSGGNVAVANDFILNSGVFNGAGAVTVSAGNLTINDGDFQPTGTVALTAGNLSVAATATGNMSPLGTIGVGGTSTFAGGAFVHGSTLTSTGLVRVNGAGAVLTSNGTLNADAGLQVSSGTLNGTGTINVTGTVTLDGGSLSGTGRTINVDGDWTETAAGFIDTSGTVNITGACTMTTASAFYNLTIGADTSLANNLSIGNTLTQSGTATLTSPGGQSISVTADLDITGTSGGISFTAAGALTVGTTTDLTSGTGIILGTGDDSFGGTVTNGGEIIAGTGTVTFGADYSGASGTLTGNGASAWYFAADAVFGTVNMNGDGVEFTTAAASHNCTPGSAGVGFDRIVIPDNVTLNLLSGGTLLADILQIGTNPTTGGEYDNGAEFDANEANFNINTVDNGGTFTLMGNQTTMIVTNFDSDSGWLVYNGDGALITITLDNASFSNVWNLRIQDGNYRLGQNMTVNGHGADQDSDSISYNDEGLFITAGGRLEADTFDIIVAEAFVQSGDFVCNSSNVIFEGAGESYIEGDVTFYRLTDSFLDRTASIGYGGDAASYTPISGKYLYIRAGDTITIAPNGYITLSGDPSVGPSNDPLTAADEPTSTYLKLWSTSTAHFNLLISPSAYAFMENLCVWYSDASSNPVILQNNVFVFDCPGWVDFVSVLDSITLDTDNNGKIDAIQARVEVAVNQELGGAFSDFYVQVVGYDLDSANPYDDGADQYHFLINLQEKPYLDTDAVPEWRILQNSSFMDAATGNKPVTILLGAVPDTPAHGPVSPTDTPMDEADPVIGYTLAVPGNNEMFIQFSEPVQDSGGADPTGADFTFTGLSVAATGLTPVTAGGSGGIKEALIQFGGPLTTADVLAGTIAPGNTFQDTAVPDTYDLPDPNQINLALARNNAHAISDVLIGPTNNGPVEPLWAQDSTTASATGSGTGVINEFDGTQHLKDEDITLQAHLNTDIDPVADLGGADIQLRFIQNPDGTYVNGNGLWIDSEFFAETTFSGLVSYPLDYAGIVQVNGTAEVFNNQVWDFDLSNGDIVNNADLSFLFYLPGIGRYAARIGDHTAADWYRRVYPWSFGVHNIVDQGAGVSILNNVINPLKGEQTTLYYNLQKGGMVSVQIFDLAGGLVEILHRGRQDAGEYSLSWNGTNRSNNPVARGIYFVRLVGPGVDEMRKVLVVK